MHFRMHLLFFDLDNCRKSIFGYADTMHTDMITYYCLVVCFGIFYTNVL